LVESRSGFKIPILIFHIQSVFGFPEWLGLDPDFRQGLTRIQILGVSFAGQKIQLDLDIDKFNKD